MNATFTCVFIRFEERAVCVLVFVHSLFNVRTDVALIRVYEQHTVVHKVNGTNGENTNCEPSQRNVLLIFRVMFSIRTHSTIFGCVQCVQNRFVALRRQRLDVRRIVCNHRAQELQHYGMNVI